MIFFFFQAEDGIRDLVRSRGLGDVYKRQADATAGWDGRFEGEPQPSDVYVWTVEISDVRAEGCLLYTSDAADERSSVDLGGRRIIKKKKTTSTTQRYVAIDNIRESRHAARQN